MSTQPKKPSTKPSGATPRQFIAELLAAVGATPADDLLDRVFAEHEATPALVAIVKGHTPFHRTCGAVCSFIIAHAMDRPGHFHIGVTCPKCLREIHTEETWYAPYSE